MHTGAFLPYHLLYLTWWLWKRRLLLLQFWLESISNLTNVDDISWRQEALNEFSIACGYSEMEDVHSAVEEAAYWMTKSHTISDYCRINVEDCRWLHTGKRESAWLRNSKIVQEDHFRLSMLGGYSWHAQFAVTTIAKRIEPRKKSHKHQHAVVDDINCQFAICWFASSGCRGSDPRWLELRCILRCRHSQDDIPR
jgi:hypothetical protein